MVRSLRRPRRRRGDGREARRDAYLAHGDRGGSPGEAMSKADLFVERGASFLEELSHKAAAEGGLVAKLAEPLADDAAFFAKDDADAGHGASARGAAAER